MARRTARRGGDPAAGARQGRRRRLGVAILLGTVLLVTFAVFILDLSESAVRRQAEARVRSTAELSARLISEQTLRLEEVVGTYAVQLRDLAPPRRAQLSPEDRARADRALTGLVSQAEGISSAVLTDPQGRIVRIAPSGLLPLRTDLSGRDWYRGLRGGGGRPYLSKAYLSATRDHTKIAVVALEVRNRDGQQVGILAAAERGRTQRLTDRYGEQVGARLSVTDQAGTVVGQTGRPTPRLVSRRSDPLVAAALKGASGVRVRDLDGERTVSGFAAVPGTGWTVVADVPADEAFKDVERLRITVLIGTGIMAFLLLWLLPLLTERLGRAREALGVSEAFQRDLLPSVLPAGVRTRYVASERRMLLGGDFLDAVVLPDGGVAVCIGDVCGHGPRAAALGATLRAGWRTLASAGQGVDGLAYLDRLVESERPDSDLFATMAVAEVGPDLDRVRYCVAGHPPPVLVDARGGGRPLLDGRGPALGFGVDGTWEAAETPLEPGFALALYTDGLIESRATPQGPRLGLPRLLDLVRRHAPEGRLDVEALLAEVDGIARQRSDGLDDDLALVLLDGATLRAARPPLAHGARS